MVNRVFRNWGWVFVLGVCAGCDGPPRAPATGEPPPAAANLNPEKGGRSAVHVTTDGHAKIGTGHPTELGEPPSAVPGETGALNIEGEQIRERSGGFKADPAPKVSPQ